MLNVSNFINLPNDELYVVGGVILNKDELEKSKKYSTAKTLDFKWDYKDYEIYASHKYTKDKGGAQNHQYKELQDFIKSNRDSLLENTIFVAIADGEYYSTKDTKASMTKMQYLESLCTAKVIACNMDNLINKLDAVCNTKPKD